MPWRQHQIYFLVSLILRYYHQRPGRLFNSWLKLIRISKAPHYCLVLREIHRSNPLTRHPECLKRLKAFPGHDVVILKERKKHSLQPSPPWYILQWSHNEDDGVWNHRRHNCFLSTVCSGAGQRKHQSFASLFFVRGIHRSPAWIGYHMTGEVWNAITYPPPKLNLHTFCSGCIYSLRTNLG